MIYEYPPLWLVLIVLVAGLWAAYDWWKDDSE